MTADVKVFICGGGRNGSTLVHKCLLQAGLRNWGPSWAFGESSPVASTEPKKFRRLHYELFDFDEIVKRLVVPLFDVAKLPEFDYYISDLNRRYPHAHFVVIERSPIGQVSSTLRVGWIQAYKRDRFRNPELRAAMEPWMESWDDPLQVCFAHFNALRVAREKAVKELGERLITVRYPADFRLDRFDDTVRDLADRLGIDPEPHADTWHDMRRERLQRYVKPREYFFKD